MATSKFSPGFSGKTNCVNVLTIWENKQLNIFSRFEEIFLAQFIRNKYALCLQLNPKY